MIIAAGRKDKDGMQDLLDISSPYFHENSPFQRAYRIFDDSAVTWHDK
jgi:hypothetical protein